MLRSLIRDDSAVNVTMGYILNLAMLLIVTGSIAGAFYLRAEDSSRQAMRVGFADLGSEIARDITNMYLASAHSNNISLNVTRRMPITIGGKSYGIELKNASSKEVAYVDIKEAGYFMFEVVTKINSIDSNSNVKISCEGVGGIIVYSGPGEININMTKNNTGWYLCIK